MAASRIPLVVVLGTTGAGKSKLAIEIAKVFSGEIISADSMQIYKGLDIISNKVTEEEQAEAPHHLISYLEPDHKHYNVVDFRDAAIPIIGDLISRSKIPIIVGGTNYYIESILWDFLVNKVAKDHDGQFPPATQDEEAAAPAPRETRSSGPVSAQVAVEDNAVISPHTCDQTEFPPSPKRAKSEKFSGNFESSGNVAQATHKSATSQSSSSLATSSSSPFPSISSSSSSPFPSTTSSSSSSQPATQSSSHNHCISTTSEQDHSGLESQPTVSVSRQLPTVTVPSALQHTRQTEMSMPSHASVLPGLSITDKTTSTVGSKEVKSNCVSYDGSTFSTASPSPTGVFKHSSPSGVFVSESKSCELNHSLGVNNMRPGSSSHGLQTVAGASPGAGTRSDGQGSVLSSLATLTASELYTRLQEVDPDSAARQHPNNTRKVLRALQVFYETGRTLSSLLEEQHQGRQGAKSGPLRYQDPCILWVKCRQPELDRRLDARVDTMLEKGLLEELEDFYEKAQSLHSEARSGPDDKGYIYPHGMLQMLGFKEFTSYLRLSPDQRTSEEGKKLFQQGVDDLKKATRRYAKQQVRWITNRFCARPGSSVPPVYSVDSTDLSTWDQAVAQAVGVVQAFTQGETPSLAPEPTQKKVDSTVVRQVCEVCGGRVFLHQHEWSGHLKSKKHRHNMKLLRREREKLSSTLTAREAQLTEKTSPAPQPFHTESNSNSETDVADGGNAPHRFIQEVM